ncbi:pentatricopeptide repeat-containing protein At1g07590, mitochondrial [Selaginella moellendorffii]|uniref:pentatricopeptide repeat-containing protein At1g07590, mitochondrial n=1 Tax=Selaginella moellendorffii TaxID=88036 RepID=UPI000D1CE7B1|nr:pentatricopeptide repeat-containing protein At1g07590, mitochondrial [Selaginella moellendorffii]|eukprot:XP_024525641.1 pentatricopeptide repeat-containing protein At1g07590, mitochondrial [Selaginella moellendorffii]
MRLAGMRGIVAISSSGAMALRRRSGTAAGNPGSAGGTDDPQGSRQEIDLLWRPEERSIVLPHLDRRNMEYQDKLELVWDKVRDVPGHRVSSYINWLVDMGEIDSKPMVLSIIRKLTKRQKYKTALDVGNWLLFQKAFEIDDRDYVLQVDYYAHVDMYLAEMAFNRLPDDKKTEEAYNYILAGFVRNRMLEKAVVVMDKIRELGLVSAFSLEQMTLLFHYLGLERRIPALVVEARSLGLHFHPHFLNTHLWIKRRHGDLSGMEEIVEELELMGRSNAWTYIFIASAYIQAGLPEKAHAALGAAEAGIRNGRFKKQRKVYNKILLLYGLLKDTEGIERVWGILNSRPLVAVHNHLFMIEALGSAGNIGRAEEIFEELRKCRGVRKEYRQFIVMAGAYTKNGLMDKATEVLYDYPAKYKARPVPELYHYFIKGYIKRNEKDWAIEAYEEGQSLVRYRSTKLWYETMLEVMSIYAERGDVTSALAMFKHCKACKHRDIRMFTLLFKTYVVAKEPAHGLIKRMVMLGFEPNDEIRELILELKPIRKQFEEDRFERKVFGKPHLQWLRWEDDAVKRRWFGRGPRRKVRQLLRKVNRYYKRKKRVWSTEVHDDPSLD